VSNCTGTPADRANADVTYLYGPFTISTIANFRGGFRNVETQASTSCEEIDHTGASVPGNCRIGSFMTFDLTARWQATKNVEIFATVQNLFDRVPPFDPTTYGSVGFNPLDYQGAIGRFVSAGLRAKF
jgi:iron complex outermembrane recepter protein